MSYLAQLFFLVGKIGVVTGAIRGIGRGLAEALLRAGARVILVATNEERLEETTRSFVEQGLDASARRCDLEDAQQIDELVEWVEHECGRIDVLVNAAGVTYTHHLLDYPDEQWEKTLRIDLDAPFRLSRGFGRMMKEQGGGDNPAYGAAKGALRQLTKAMAVDLGPFGIRVNNIGPGYFRTDMTRGSWSDPEMRQQRIGRTILNRGGEVEDMAGMVVLLASDASSYITGQDFYVDGGWVVKLV